MTSRIHHLSTRACMAACALALAQATLCAQQPEPTIDASEGTAEPMLIAYGEHTVNAAIDTSVDVDRFEFAGKAGDKVRLLANAHGNYLDLALEIYDPSFAPVSSHVLPNGASKVIEETLELDGTYTILASDSGANEGDGYLLQLERMPPLLNVTPLDYGVPVWDDLGVSTDVDFFQLNVAAGSLVRVIVNASGNYLDPSVEVYDEAWQLVDSASCSNGCSLQIDISVSKTEAYTIVISDSGTNEGDGYVLSAQCVLGTCPPPSPWTNLGDGLAGVTGVPILVCTGTLEGNTPVGLTAANARKNSSLTLVFGISTIYAPFKGGVLVPHPDVLVDGLMTGADGVVDLGTPWPVDYPAGFAFYGQAVVQDPDAPFGLALSNAVEGVTP